VSSRILGLDPGEKRIGVAVSDVTCTIASPVDFVERGGDGYEQRLQQICDEWQIAEIVVGLPVGLDGTEGKSAANARTFGEAVGLLTGLSVNYCDERFTTVTAEKALIEGGVRRRKRTTMRDQVAAAVMLQNYLDARRYKSGYSTTPDE